MADSLDELTRREKAVIEGTTDAITDEDRATLNGAVMTFLAKSEFDDDRFTAEVRRAMCGRSERK